MQDDVPDRDDWFVVEQGFPYPDWPTISLWMNQPAPVGDRTSDQSNAHPADDGGSIVLSHYSDGPPSALSTLSDFVTRPVTGRGSHDDFVQIARHWLARMRLGLGGGYSLAESDNFHLLSELPPKDQSELLKFLEQTRSRMLGVLGSSLIETFRGKHIVMRFTELDDYYDYVARYFPDGSWAGSSGMMIAQHYCHIAFPSVSPYMDRAVLAHELTHNLLVTLPLPTWLNEALAMLFEDSIASTPWSLDADNVALHRDYWNSETIQQFWAGTAFHDVEAQPLAYELSKILLSLIQTEVRPSAEVFRRFIQHAEYSDAGSMACRVNLNWELGDLAGRFLGPGEWGPIGQTG